jgi:hypothetical protein
MERKSQSRSIGGKQYTVRQMGAKQGSRMLVRLMRVVANGLDGGKVSLAAIADGLDDDMFIKLVDELAPTTEVDLGDGRVLTFDKVLDLQFAGQYQDMLEWLVFALEVNYSDFFSAFLRKKADAEKAAEAAGAAPKG